MTIVDIDDASLAAIGQWPWPRSVFAELFGRLGELRRGGGRLRHPVSPSATATRRRSMRARSLAGRDPELAAALRGLPDNDALMAGAMAASAVVLGVAGDPAALDAIDGAKLRPSPVVALGEDPRRFLPELAGLGRRHARRSARPPPGSGLVTLTPDVDGIVRRVPLVGSVAGQLLPSLALEALRIAVGADKVFVRSGRRRHHRRHLGGADAPGRPGGPRLGPLWPAATRTSMCRAADVLAGPVPPDRLEGHIVFIGASAAGLGDIKPAPIVGTMPGVEIQASLLQTLVSGSILRRPVEVVQLENLTLLVLGLVLAWAGPFLRASYLPAAAGRSWSPAASVPPGMRSATMSCWSTASMSRPLWPCCCSGWPWPATCARRRAGAPSATPSAAICRR